MAELRRPIPAPPGGVGEAEGPAASAPARVALVPELRSPTDGRRRDTAEFEPPWWLATAHLQTLAPALVRGAARVATEHERVELPDGDFVDLHWVGREWAGPVVVLVPGMQGSERSECVRSLLAECARLNLRAVVLNHRGAHVANRVAGSYHAGFIDHLAWLVGLLQQRAPGVPLHAVGFSLGGSILIRYLAEAGDASGLASCAAVSVTFDLERTATRACEGFNRVYQQRVLRSYLRATRLKAHLPEIASRLPALRKVRTIRAFDGIITGPLHGFTDAEDYYRQCSSQRFLGGVRTPLLILNAKDDPLAPPDTLPTPSSMNSCIRLELTGRGGHLGFLERRGSTWRPWIPGRVLPFLLQGSGT